MPALFKQTLALALFAAACSNVAADDEPSGHAPVADDQALSLAGASPQTAAPTPLTEEELQRRLDALEREINIRK